jgi:hypothetical protein
VPIDLAAIRCAGRQKGACFSSTTAVKANAKRWRARKPHWAAT